MAGASVGILSDDSAKWPEGDNSILLERFHYGAIVGNQAAIDAKTRLEWLRKADHLNGFSPQPYEQLAKVLRDMGHREDARVVMIEKERLQREAQNPSWWRRVWNRVMRVSAGYGYRPSLSIYWLLGLWLAGALVFGAADLNGSVKPNSDRIWDQKEWKDCEGAMPSQKWC